MPLATFFVAFFATLPAAFFATFFVSFFVAFFVAFFAAAFFGAAAPSAAAFFAGAYFVPALRPKRPRCGRNGAASRIASHSSSDSDFGSRSLGILPFFSPSVM